MRVYSIKDLELLSGIKAHTLRIWEQRHGILHPTRSDTNIRSYSDDQLKRVLKIAYLQSKGGFKISEISKMSDDDIVKHTFDLSQAKVDFPEQIQAVTLAMLDLDESRFQQLARINIEAHGFEAFMLHIIHPFLRRLGTLWIAGSVGPAHEHFISHLIRQKVIAAIDAQILPAKSLRKKVLLYLPTGELHEIGLLFANYIFRARNHDVIYLGQSLPFEDLLLANEIHQPDFIFSVFTSEPNADIIDKYLARMAKELKGPKLLITGYQALLPERKISNDIQVLSDFEQLIAFAEA